MHVWHVNFVLDFLAHLNDQKFAYSTINFHKSQIPAYNDLEDNTELVNNLKYVH